MSAQGERQFKAFHGRPSNKRLRVRIKPLSELILLGEAVEIVYRCRKLNGGGDGKMAEYEHKFSKGVSLYCTPDGDNILVLHGNRLKVREPGIIH